MGMGIPEKINAWRPTESGQRRDKTNDRKKVIALWFFCHEQMVTFVSSSVLLRRDVALKWSFTAKYSHACVQ
jgi:hypothetical protein